MSGWRLPGTDGGKSPMGTLPLAISLRSLLISCGGEDEQDGGTHGSMPGTASVPAGAADSKQQTVPSH